MRQIILSVMPGFLYSGEAEILFGPMTGLEVLHAGRIHGTMNHYVMRCASTHKLFINARFGLTPDVSCRPTVNQRAVLIEVGRDFPRVYTLRCYNIIRCVRCVCVVTNTYCGV